MLRWVVNVSLLPELFNSTLKSSQFTTDLTTKSPLWQHCLNIKLTTSNRPHFIAIKQVSMSSHSSSICQTGVRDELRAELLLLNWGKCPWTKNWICASSTGAALSLHSAQKAIITSPSNKRIYTLWRHWETQAECQHHTGRWRYNPQLQTHRAQGGKWI